MTNFEKTQLTDLGASLVGKQGMSITFTKAEAGCGIYASGEDVRGATALRAKIQDIPISSACKISEAAANVKFLISNKKLAEGYLLTEIGVYAMDPDEGEILYAVCFSSPESSQEIMAYNGIFSNSAVISLRVQISPGAEPRFEPAGAYALAEDLQKANKSIAGLASPDYDTPEKRENLSPGESLLMALGKIRRFFIDLKAVAFSGSYTDLEDKPSASDVGAAPYAVVNGSDFNEMTIPGIYTMRFATNGPTDSSYHSLIVLKSDSGNYVQQMAVKEGTTDVYVRYGSSRSWSDWARLIKDGEVVKYSKTAESAGYAATAGGAEEADKVDGKHASDFLGNATGYQYPGVSAGDANDYRTEWHGFVYGMANIPAADGTAYGFLDVSYYGGAGFTPSSSGVVMQKFTHWKSKNVFIRTYVSGSWTNWSQYTDLSGGWTAGSATGTLSAVTGIGSSGLGIGGFAATVGSFKEIEVLPITTNSAWVAGWSYSGTTLVVMVVRCVTSVTTVTVPFIAR